MLGKNLFPHLSFQGWKGFSTWPGLTCVIYLVWGRGLELGDDLAKVTELNLHWTQLWRDMFFVLDKVWEPQWDMARDVQASGPGWWVGKGGALASASQRPNLGPPHAICPWASYLTLLGLQCPYPKWGMVMAPTQSAVEQTIVHWKALPRTHSKCSINFSYHCYWRIFWEALVGVVMGEHSVWGPVAVVVCSPQMTEFLDLYKQSPRSPLFKDRPVF